MEVHLRIIIDERKIPFDPVTLLRWKARDPEIVPESHLQWKGPGISNGYGFGEWIAEKYFKSEGYDVINNEFNIVAKTSKFRENNRLIENLIGKERVKNFAQKVRELTEEGNKIVSHLDLFVYSENEKDYFFVEVKKEQDRLRQEQASYIYLAELLLNVRSILVTLDETIHKAQTNKIEFGLEGDYEFKSFDNRNSKLNSVLTPSCLDSIKFETVISFHVLQLLGNNESVNNKRFKEVK